MLNSIKNVLLFVPLVFALCESGMAFADVYKWIDGEGMVHYTDKKPKGFDAKKIDTKISTYQSISYGKSIYDTGQKVVMYSTSWCKYCKKARRYFQTYGIPFTDYDIEKNADARRRYRKMGATGVPVILVGNRRMNGFSAAGFERIYRP